MSLSLRLMSLRSVVKPKLGVRYLRSTSSTHPEPIYNEDDKVLEKVLENRTEDVPISIRSPYEKPKKQCVLCSHGIEPNYKNVKLLSQFVSPHTGMVYGRHITGLCKTKQHEVEMCIHTATSFGLMATYLKEVEFLKDPKLCDPEKPYRPHKY